MMSTYTRIKIGVIPTTLLGIYLGYIRKVICPSLGRLGNSILIIAERQSFIIWLSLLWFVIIWSFSKGGIYLIDLWNESEYLIVIDRTICHELFEFYPLLSGFLRIFELLLEYINEFVQQIKQHMFTLRACSNHLKGV